MPSEFNETVSNIRNSFKNACELKEKLNQEISQLRKEILCKAVQCDLIDYALQIGMSRLISEGQKINIADGVQGFNGGNITVTHEDIDWLVAKMPEFLRIESKENRNTLCVEETVFCDSKANNCELSE